MHAYLNALRSQGYEPDQLGWSMLVPKHEASEHGYTHTLALSRGVRTSRHEHNSLAFTLSHEPVYGCTHCMRNNDYFHNY